MKKQLSMKVLLVALFALFSEYGAFASVHVTKDKQVVVSTPAVKVEEKATIPANEALGIKTTLIQPQALAYMVSCLS